MAKRTYIILHHTAAEEKDTEQVRRYHMDIRGYQDIAYNKIIEKDGKLVLGRSLKIAGAHTRADGMNRKSIGYALIGNLENREPTRQQMETLIKSIQEDMAEYSISVENVLGHKEVKGAATLCPGKHTDMDQLRKDLVKPKQQEPDDTFKYIVKAGDTLSHLAVRFKTNVRKIAQDNNIQNVNFIRVGAHLIIGGAEYHTIKKGDTLWALAIHYNTNVLELQRLNPKVNPRALEVESKLRVK